MASINSLRAFNLQKWIDENRDKLKPPVGNAQIWEDGEFMVTVVGGPNQRRDYHDDPTEEFFYQLKGDIALRVMEEAGKPPKKSRSAKAKFSCCPSTCATRRSGGADTVGLVIEMPRPEDSLDAFEWYCPNCHNLVHRAEVRLKSIVRDLPPLFDKFYGSEELRRCKTCGTVHPGRA